MLQGSLAGVSGQQQEDANQNTNSTVPLNGALTDTDMVPSESSSPVQQTNGVSSSQQQPQQTEGLPQLPQQQQQQQQESKSGIHLSEMRYELGPELKQVRGAPP